MPDNRKTYKLPAGRYSDIPVVELIALVTEESDRDALREFHDNRMIFALESGDAMVMAKFIDTICCSRWAMALAGCNYNLIEKAYYHLIDRFSNLPNEEYPDGVDCRYYFDAFLTNVHSYFEQNDITNPLKRELIAAKTLQNMVVRHFKYCLKESCRQSNPLRSRYQWHVNGGSITVWMPVFKSGGERKSWLDENIDAPDPSRAGERYRIQQIIDSLLGTPVIHGFDGEFIHSDSAENDFVPDCEQIDVKGLAKAVADEKTQNIDSMRPAIRSLGKQKLAELIRSIFRDISYDCYEEKAVAEKFTISRPTLSRFAGSRWRISDSACPPDLWSNLAKVLAKNDSYKQAARNCRIWDRVLETIRIKG